MHDRDIQNSHLNDSGVLPGSTKNYHGAACTIIDGRGSNNVIVKRLMEEVKEAIKCMLIGVKDSVIGVWPVVYLLKK